MCKYSGAYDYKLSVLIPFSYLSGPTYKCSQLKLCKYKQKYHLYIRFCTFFPYVIFCMKTSYLFFSHLLHLRFALSNGILLRQ
jgi:hypothetical protein